MFYVFISHSKKDTELVEIINHNFRSMDVVPLFMEFAPESEPPYKKIEEHIKLSDAVFLFLTQNVVSSDYTKNWISFEVGLAKASNKPVFVIEDFNGKINFPVPYLTDYILYEPTKIEDWTNLRKILQKLKRVVENNRSLLGLTGLGAILGGLIDQEDRLRGILIGSIGGAIFAGILNALTPAVSVDPTRIKCAKCGIEFNLYSRARLFPCPSCRTELRSL
jgi:hypothetical protein